MSTQRSTRSGRSKRKRTTEEVIARIIKKSKYIPDPGTASSLQRAVGFPRQKRVNFKYVTQGKTSIPVGGLGGYNFSANSLYDPDRTSSGHQPSQFDTWSTMYNHYCVLGATIKLTASFPGAVGLIPIAVGINLCDATTLPSTTDYTTNIENGARHGIMPAYSSEKIVIKHRFDAKTMFSNSDPVAKDSLCALTSNSPSDEAYFLIWFQDLAGAGSAGAYIYWQAELEYKAMMFEPKPFIQS